MTRRLYRAAPRPLRPDTFGVGRGDFQGCDGLGVDNRSHLSGRMRYN